MLADMNGFLKPLAASTAVLALAACGPTSRSVIVEPAGGGAAVRPQEQHVPGGSYRVVKGDTLYSIAFRNRVDYRSLAAWNGIDQSYTIWPGQVLRLSPPGAGGQHGAGVATAAQASVAAHAAGQAQHAAPPPAASAPVFENVATTPAAPASAASSPHPAPAPAASRAPAAPAGAVAAASVAPAASAPPSPPPAAPVPAGSSRSSGGVAWRWPADGQLIKRFQSGDAIPGIEIAGKAGDPVRAAADGTVVYSGNGLVGYGELIIIKHNDSLLSAYGHNRKRLVQEGQKVSAGQQIAEMGSTGATRDELQFQIRLNGNPVDPLGYLPGR
jgi:lipoprotein NlpD